MHENQPLNATGSNGTKGTKIVIWNLCMEALGYYWSLSEKTDRRTFPTPIEKVMNVLRSIMSKVFQTTKETWQEGIVKEGRLIPNVKSNRIQICWNKSNNMDDYRMEC